MRFPLSLTTLLIFSITLSIGCILVTIALSILLVVHSKSITERYAAEGPIYHLSIYSFLDTNGNGIGDLAGLRSRLEYLEWLGITTIWLAPIYKSPFKNYGFDISDYTAINSDFGNIHEFRNLVEEIHQKGMRIMIDFVPNHTSSKHPWFLRSSAKASSKYDNYYIWRNGTWNSTSAQMMPPNDWISRYGAPAWTWSDSKKMFYFHQYFPEQPDLNLQNLEVRNELNSALQYWMDMGVDGFRLDSVSYLIEFIAEDLALARLNEPSYSYNSLLHAYDSQRKESIKLVESWVELIKQYEAENKRKIFTAVASELTAKEATLYKSIGIDLFLGLEMTQLSFHSNVYRLLLDHQEREFNKMYQSGWMLSGLDSPRVATKFGGPHYSKAAYVFLLLQPGVPVIYYGDEIGMTDVFVDFQNIKDPLGLNAGKLGYQKLARDFSRAVMQWNDSPNAGFSTIEPNTLDLPLASNCTTVNVELQMGSPKSILRFIRNVIQLRHKLTITNRVFRSVDTRNNDVAAYTCYSVKLQRALLIIVNFGSAGVETIVDMSGEVGSDRGKLLLRTDFGDDTVLNEDQIIILNNIFIADAEGYVIEILDQKPGKIIA